MSISIEDGSLFSEKAKSKKDGVYSLRWYLYAVIWNRFVAYMDYRWDFYQCFWNFVTKIWLVEDRTKRRSEIKKWMIEEKKSMYY